MNQRMTTQQTHAEVDLWRQRVVKYVAARKCWKNSYLHPHPLAAPQPVLCGSQGRTNKAVIWLTDEEEREYRRGVRVFHLNRYKEVQVS